MNFLENFLHKIKNDYKLIAVVCVLVFSVSTIGILDIFTENVYSIENSTNYINNSNYNDLSPLSILFKNVEKSVVQISTSSSTDDPLGMKLGSGFVFDSEGHIITNNHVVEGNDYADVTFSDGTIFRSKVIGTDPYSDLAVLEVANITKDKINPLPIGNSSNLVVGQEVAAVGNPFGLSGTLTEGIISGLGRLLPTSFDIDPTNPNLTSYSIPGVIQTDAAINPGNSGGPLLNLKGEVIGINSAIYSNSGAFSGVGFAIPSNIVLKVSEALIKTGKYAHPWIGISGSDITPSIAEKMNLNETRGFLVIDVTAGSPADKAGIIGGDKLTEIDGREIELGGDVIIGIDNNTVRKIDDVISYLENHKKVGDNISLTINRDGKIMRIQLTLEERPDNRNIVNTHPTIGIVGSDVTKEIAEKMNLNETRGFLVIDVTAGSPADKAGIKGGYKTTQINNTSIRLGGDVIIGIGDKKVNTISDISEYLKDKGPNDKISVTIIRDGQIKKIDVQLDEKFTEEMRKKPQSDPFGDDRFLDPYDENIPDNFFDNLLKECQKDFGMEMCKFLFK